MNYCANKDCPFSDCNKHLDNAPKVGVITMSWFDGTCRDYIGWLIDEVKKDRKKDLKQRF